MVNVGNKNCSMLVIASLTALLACGQADAIGDEAYSALFKDNNNHTITYKKIPANKPYCANFYTIPGVVNPCLSIYTPTTKENSSSILDFACDSVSQTTDTVLSKWVSTHRPLKHKSHITGAASDITPVLRQIDNDSKNYLNFAHNHYTRLLAKMVLSSHNR